MNVKEKGEAILLVLAHRHNSLTKNRLKIEYQPRAKYIYHARRLNDGRVNLYVGFFPGFKGWETHFGRALAACDQLLSGRSIARAIQLPFDSEEEVH